LGPPFIPAETGGTNSDAIADASSELQAIGRVYRAGQTKHEVNVYKIIVEGPKGEELLDGQLIRRNTNDETVAMATNAAD
jgi:SNF2 family DNA or RNA helicase